VAGGFRSVRKGGSLLLTGALFLGVLVLVNMLAARRSVRGDWTAENRWSLSPQTMQILAGLDRDVSLVAFMAASDPAQDDVLRLFEEYEAASPRITTDIVDPDREPGRAAQYDMREYGLIATTGERPEKARAFTEEGITNALLRALRPRPLEVAFLSGHGEASPFDRSPGGFAAAGEALTNAGYRLRRVPLLAAGAIDDTVDIVVIAGPRAEYLPEETALLDEWLDRGGRLLVLLDPSPGAGMADWLATRGIQVGDDRIVDPSPRGRMVGLDAFAPVVTRYEQNPITRGFNLTTYFRLARSVGLPETLPTGIRGYLLFRSGPGSWAESDPVTTPPRLDPGPDRLGPIPMAAAIEVGGVGAASLAPDASSLDEARLVVFGDSDFAANRDWRVPGGGDLFLNALAWLGERGDEIAVRAAPVVERRVELTARESRTVFLLGVVGLPLLVVAAGLWTAWRRRPL
jgi:ABC-type uncharacterized transport system involved in gliding motility auxiliary subunit